MSGWTDERIGELKTLHATGMSFAKMARVIGGVTRNALIGKAKRLGLPARSVAHWSYEPTAARKRPEPPPEPEPEPMPERFKPANPIRLADAPYTVCRWILDDYQEPTVCGEPGYPWCKNHRARCYAPQRKEREAA